MFVGVTSDKFFGYLVNRRGIKPDPIQIKVIENIQFPNLMKEVQKLTQGLAILSRFISRYSKITQPFFTVIKKGKKFEWTEEYEKTLESQNSI